MKAFTQRLFKEHVRRLENQRSAAYCEGCPECEAKGPPSFETKHGLRYCVDHDDVDGWGGHPFLSRFVQLGLDDETREWIEIAVSAPIGMVSFALRNIAMVMMSQYAADGLMGMSNMFVLSKQQFRTLLPEFTAARSYHAESLDVGAGDGGVTLNLAPLFDRVSATEISSVLAWRLYSKGINSITTGCLREGGIVGNQTFDLVSCFNVLDRCDHPTQLLRDLHACVKPTGLVMLAVVLPFCPCVMTTMGQRAPKEPLSLFGCESGMSWEQCMVEMVGYVESCGFELQRWSRIPYVSRGTSSMPIYTLDDAILILKPISGANVQSDSSKGEESALSEEELA